MTCHEWSSSIRAAPCLVCSLMLKTAVWSRFSRQYSSWTPPRHSWVFSLTALNLQTAHFQHCSLNKVDANNAAIKQLASVLLFFLLSSLPHRASHLLYTLLSRIAEGLLCVAAEITSTPENPVRTRFPSSSSPLQNHCIVKGIST